MESCSNYGIRDYPSVVGNMRDSWNESTQFSWFMGIEGSKQPQDFGINANLGGRARVVLSGSAFPELGIGYQIGTAFTASSNAVQVAEILGEAPDRVQSFNTVGLFQRTNSGFFWGGVYDYQFTDSFDKFNLSQWRIRIGHELGEFYEIGATVNLAVENDRGFFNDIEVELEPIDQFHVFIRRYWPTGANTAAWIGQAQSHGEDNAVFGAQARKENTLLVGADLFVPLTRRLAIYGETNLMAPADTGAVDAFLGLEFSTTRVANNFRNLRYRPLLPVASSTSLTNDLRIIRSR